MAPLINDLFGGDTTAFVNKVNSQFQAVASDLPHFDVPQTAEDVPDNFLPEVQQVQKMLSLINPRKATGPDGVPNWILREAADILAGPITSIVAAGMCEQSWPNIWLSGEVIPLAKTHPPRSIESDLRPITLTCGISKYVVEKILTEILKKYVLPFIDTRQFGSIKGRSTTQALVSLLHQLYEATDRGQSARILLIDFSKGFDRIDIGTLIGKVMSLGVPSFLSRWLATFLARRFQRVRHLDITSTWLDLHAGVPQGTLTGPLAFILMINDLNVEYKYVDDSTVVEVLNEPEMSNMQGTVNKILAWTTLNHMKINGRKTKELQISFKKKPFTWPPLEVENVPILPVESVCLLGIQINATLTWNSHVDYITRKASKRIYFIIMLKRANIPYEKIITVFTAMIRSILEYACPAWHTNITLVQHRKIENIQKRVLKILYPQLPYDEALVEANLVSLKDRREAITKKFFLSVNQGHPLYNLLADYARPPPVVDLRNRRSHFVRCKTQRFEKSLVPYGISHFL